MSVIPPNRVEAASNQVPWLNMQKVAMASAPQVLANKSAMDKTASASTNKIVHSYGCRCGKKWSADNAAFTSQVNLAKRAGEKSVDLSCPSCGENVFPLGSIQRASSKDESRSAAIFAAKDTNLQTTSSTYNTFIDRHVVFKATQALQNYASSMGMHMPRVKYLQGVHTKEAGFDIPIITSFSAEIEWQYGRNQKMRVMANVGIDAAGKIKMPKVFKTADFQEHPFDKDYVISMQKNVSPKLMGDTRRKTDLQQYRKTDPSRFRAVAAFGDADANVFVIYDEGDGDIFFEGVKSDADAWWWSALQGGDVDGYRLSGNTLIDAIDGDVMYSGASPEDVKREWLSLLGNTTGHNFSTLKEYNQSYGLREYDQGELFSSKTADEGGDWDTADAKCTLGTCNTKHTHYNGLSEDYSGDAYNKLSKGVCPICDGGLDKSYDKPQGQVQAKIEANLRIGDGGMLNVKIGATALLLAKKEGLHTVAFQVDKKQVKIDMQESDFNTLFNA